MQDISFRLQRASRLVLLQTMPTIRITRAKRGAGLHGRLKYASGG